jgi:hypothetical protein
VGGNIMSFLPCLCDEGQRVLIHAQSDPESGACNAVVADASRLANASAYSANFLGLAFCNCARLRSFQRSPGRCSRCAIRSRGHSGAPATSESRKRRSSAWSPRWSSRADLAAGGQRGVRWRTRARAGPGHRSFMAVLPALLLPIPRRVNSASQPAD